MRSACATVVAGLLLMGPSAVAGDESTKSGRADAKTQRAGALAMTPAVACRLITGFDDYEPLPGARLTSDEKLLVYYQPLNYRIEPDGRSYHIHLTQDGQIRRHGEKPVLMRKEKLLDYDSKGDSTLRTVFLRNTIALKGLKPGDYDFDIILHDELSKEPAAVQTLHFVVVAPVLPKADDPGAAPSAPSAKKKAKRPGRKAASLRR